MNINGECPFCHSENEDVNHLSKLYSFTATIWAKINLNCPDPIIVIAKLLNGWSTFGVTGTGITKFVLILWTTILWAIRNHRIILVLIITYVIRLILLIGLTICIIIQFFILIILMWIYQVRLLVIISITGGKEITLDPRIYLYTGLSGTLILLG